jgi:TatD DNase family protein
MFRGIYHGKQAHADDFAAIIQRSKDVGIKAIIITASYLDDVRQALEIAATDRMYPTTC